MTNYKTGDVVTLEHEDGSRLVNLEVKALITSGTYVVVPGTSHYLWMRSATDTGWRVTDHKPKIQLPTEDGYYIDNEGDGWVLEKGQFTAIGEDCDPAFAPSWYAPFTRLVPEGSEREAAIREVIAYYESIQYHDGQLIHHANAKAKFGIPE